MRLLAQLDGDHVVVSVSDRGRWHPAVDPGYRGRGLHLIRQLATEMTIEPGRHGTTVQLCAHLEQGFSPRHTTWNPS